MPARFALLPSTTTLSSARGFQRLINAVAAELAKHGAEADAPEERTRTCEYYVTRPVR
jgi:hypothetical protein